MSPGSLSVRRRETRALSGALSRTHHHGRTQKRWSVVCKAGTSPHQEPHLPAPRSRTSQPPDGAVGVSGPSPLTQGLTRHSAQEPDTVPVTQQARFVGQCHATPCPGQWGTRLSNASPDGHVAVSSPRPEAPFARGSVTRGQGTAILLTLLGGEDAIRPR